MSRRRLSDDERALWTGVARSIVPLRRARPVMDEPEAAAARSKAEPKSHARPAPLLAPPPARKSVPPALAPLGRRLKKRVARGADTIDGRLDLHGLTQAQAHDALARFLRAAQARGDRIVLVITGKGAGDRDAHGERGVLKRQVPLWLRLPEFRGVIVGFESAGIGHGGEGALYVRLRRLRPD